MKWISSLLFILLLQGCVLFERPPASMGLNVENCDPMTRTDCWSISENQLRALTNRLDRLDAELEKVREAYTFCKEGI